MSGGGYRAASAQRGPAEAPAPPPGKAEPAGKQDEAPLAERMIVYTAHLDVIVDDLDPARERLAQLLAQHKAYVAASEITGNVGTRRTGTWTLRVPVDRFRPLADALVALGHAERNKTDSQDVTAEFVDVRARVRNLKTEEDTLNRVMKEQAKSVPDVLAIREHLSKIRGDIEKSEARVKELAGLSELSTVHLTLREIKDYVPPTAPTFGATITRTWQGSLDALEALGKGVVIVAVALAPWLPLVALAGGVAYWLVRANRAKRPAAVAPPVAAPEPPGSP